MFRLFKGFIRKNVYTLNFTPVFPYIGQCLLLGMSYVLFLSDNANVYSFMQTIYILKYKIIETFQLFRITGFVDCVHRLEF
jgi:hypothetical protein